MTPLPPDSLLDINQARPGVDAAAPRPDPSGRFGPFGGRYVPETLMQTLLDLENAYREVSADPGFQRAFQTLLRDYAGRPTRLYFARRFSESIGNGARVYLKREDMLHTGAHKINNTLGQALLAKHLGKTRVIAETGAGQHGVATATACALLDLKCVVYMGTEDCERQALNVFRMKLLGAEVRPVSSGTCTLKDAINEAMRDWMANCDSTHYIFGTVAGPHPFPMIVRDFHACIGIEARQQILAAEGRLPDHLIACVGGGSNAMGIFHPFFNDTSVQFWGAEAAGHGVHTGLHAASITQGDVGVFHGSRSYVLQTPDGQITPAHSISAGLDYPGVGPEHSYYAASGRARYVPVTDAESLQAVAHLSRTEGIIPALESAHAIALVSRLVPQLPPNPLIVVNLSGRGDKDAFSLQKHLDL